MMKMSANDDITVKEFDISATPVYEIVQIGSA